MLNFDALIPKLLVNRGLSRLVYFREGTHISNKLQERLHNFYHGSVRPCHKSADIPLSINAIQVANKVDTIIIMSGDADYIELVRHLKSEGVRVEIAAALGRARTKGDRHAVFAVFDDRRAVETQEFAVPVEVGGRH